MSTSRHNNTCQTLLHIISELAETLQVMCKRINLIIYILWSSGLQATYQTTLCLIYSLMTLSEAQTVYHPMTVLVKNELE